MLLWPGLFLNAAMSQACFEVMRTLHIDRTIFVGTGWGGLVGVQFASMWPGHGSAPVIAGAPLERPASISAW